MFCRETIGDLRQLAEAHPAFPPVVFVHQGTREDAEPVFDDLWPEARAVSDPELNFYRAFGIGRGSLGQLFGPRVIQRAFGARRKGYSQGKTKGDPWFMPGAFLIENSGVVWSHDYAHAGDNPDFESLIERS